MEMNTLTLQPGLLGPLQATEGLRLLGLPAEKSAQKELSGSADEIVKTIASVLEQMVVTAIDKRTAPEFIAVRDQVLPKYAQLVLSWAGIVSAIASSSTLTRLAAESFSELEADIRDHALPEFGADIRDRAMFTVWTLRKISDVLPACAEKVDEKNAQENQEFFTSFLSNVLAARFGIDCLRVSMKSGHRIYPEVLPALDDTLKCVVDAYAWIRQAADLRSNADGEPGAIPTAWDNEDDQLLRESMIDLSRESV
jgi:hypothetical protein